MNSNENQNLQSENVKNEATEQRGTTHRYVFSQGTVDATATPKKKNYGMRTTVGVLAITLCVVISFVAGFGGAVLGGLYLRSDRFASSDGGDSLLHDDPSAILDKAGSSPSSYGSAGEDVFAVSEVVQRVQDAVVVINVSAQYGSASSGSGVIISERGYILTCHHVVEGASEMTVTLNSGSRYTAYLVGSDEPSDLAVIRIEPSADEPLTYAAQGCSADLAVGEVVVAIGNPLGTLGGTVTDGIISATERQIETSEGNTMTLLQTNAAINQGNSGGGLFNLDGKLIGIVNAKYAASGVEGLAFAIPIDLAYTVQLDLIEYGYVRGVVDHGLQVQYVEVTSRNQAYYQSNYGIHASGVYVLRSDYCEELTYADRIISVDGMAITSVEELKAAFADYNVGDTVTVVASRDNISFTTSITLREYVPDYVQERND